MGWVVARQGSLSRIGQGWHPKKGTVTAIAEPGQRAFINKIGWLPDPSWLPPRWVAGMSPVLSLWRAGSSHACSNAPTVGHSLFCVN